MRLRQGFESGAAGARLSVIGSANPDAWDYIQSSGVYNTALYDNTHARSLFSGKFSTQSSGDQVGFAEWRTASFGTQTTWYGRCYIYITSAPSSNFNIVGATDGASSVASRITITSAGKLAITNNVGAQFGLDTVAMARNQWVRIEWQLVHSATVGTGTLKVWETNADSSGSPDRTISFSGQNTLASASGVMFGVCTSLVSAGPIWIDTIEVNTTGYPGPGTDVARVPTSCFSLRTPTPLGNVTSISQVTDYTFLLSEAADRLQVVSSPTRYSTTALRVEVHTDDYDHDGTTDRTEVAATGILYLPGDDFWFGTSIMLDPSWPSSLSHWCVLFQFFGLLPGGAGAGSPSFGFEVDNDYFSLTVRGGVKATAGTAAPRDVGYHIAPITRGVWHDFKFHLHLETDSSGTVDGYHKLATTSSWPVTPTVSDTGINVLTVGGTVAALSPESGIYRQTRPDIGLAYKGFDVMDPSESVVNGYFTGTPTSLPAGYGGAFPAFDANSGTLTGFSGR